MREAPDLGLLAPIALQPDGRAPASARDTADTADYENYFRIRRVDNPEAWANAARQVTREVLEDLPSTSLEESSQRDLLAGISALLLAASSWHEGACTAYGAGPADRPRDEVRVPIMRWKLGHHLFHLLLSLMNTEGDKALVALEAGDGNEATPSLSKLARLLDSATATMHYASDFPREGYEGIIRPSMEPPWMPSRFSGIFNQEHEFLERNLKDLRRAGRSSETSDECRAALKRLWRSQSKNRRDHRKICDKFVPGGDSLLQQHFTRNSERNDD